VPEKSQGIRVKMRVASILAAHTGLPDGALASEGRIALSRQNCACKRTGGGIHCSGSGCQKGNLSPDLTDGRLRYACWTPPKGVWCR